MTESDRPARALGNGADGERADLSGPKAAKATTDSAPNARPARPTHHPGGPSATHKVSIPVAGRDRRPQSVCAPTPQWRGVAARRSWTGQYSERAFPALRVCGALRRRVRRGGGPARRGRPHHAAGTQRPAVRRHRRAGVAQARGPAGRALVQAARRLQPARPARRGGAGGRRGVRERGQPRAGRGLRLPPCSGCAGASTCPRTTPRQKRERITRAGRRRRSS